MVMLTGSTVHPCPAWALTEPVNITPRSTYRRAIATRDRRIQTRTTPSFVKSPIDVSLKNVQDPGTLDGMIGSHVFSWTVTIPDAPAADEIMVISAVASGGRPHAVLN